MKVIKMNIWLYADIIKNVNLCYQPSIVISNEGTVDLFLFLESVLFAFSPEIIIKKILQYI